jgi:hypothetical protein
METRKLKMICTKSKLGHSLSQISELTGLTIELVKQRLGQATGLSPEVLSDIFDMKQRGLSLELISQEIDVELEVLKQFLPQVIKKAVETHALADQEQGPYEINYGERAYTLGSSYTARPTADHLPTTTEETKQSQPTKTTTKTFFYSCICDTKKLLRINLVTGERSHHKVPNYQFKSGCRWSELPGGSLLITGGFPAVRDAVKIDTLREFAVSSQTPMHTGREDHAAVYHSQYLYVLAGFNNMLLSECERYSCAVSRWEVLPALPVAGAEMSAVEVENSVYALGGRTYEKPFDTIQKLSLDSLTWELMQLKLPKIAPSLLPCFKTENQVYLVIKKTLYSFTPLKVRRVKNLGISIHSESSYYSRGTLYCSTRFGMKRLALWI